MRSVNEIIYDNNISTIINDNNLLFGSKVPFGSKIPLLDNFNINDIKFDIKFIGQYFISIEDSYISV